MFKLSDNISYKCNILKETRQGFGDALLYLGKINKKVVVLCADLTSSLSMTKFSEKYSKRFFQIGIAEANMMGIASGLASSGYIPYTGTFANFSTARVYDQIRQSISYSNKNVKICASHSGISLGEDGATHQSLEDVGMMKMLPNMVIINTCDYNQTYLATIEISKYKGPVYLRFSRPFVVNFTKLNKKFKIGKALYLTYGNDVTIFTTGYLVWETIRSAITVYNEYGIECEVINLPTIKPLDNYTILQSIKKTKKVIVVEEHNYWGGIGESISRVLSRYYPTYCKIVSVKDKFGESGKPNQLIKKYKIDKNEIIKEILNIFINFK